MKAQATRSSDLEMILDWIRASKDSIADVNRTLSDSVWGAFTARGLPALHLAIQGTLVDKGHEVDLDKRNPETWNALHAAASAGYTSAVRCLLDARAEVDAKSEKGRTAAMMAAWRGHVDIVAILAEAGADLTLKDIYGTTMSAFAKKFERTQKEADKVSGESRKTASGAAKKGSNLHLSADEERQFMDGDGFVTVPVRKAKKESASSRNTKKGAGWSRVKAGLPKPKPRPGGS